MVATTTPRTARTIRYGAAGVIDFIDVQVQDPEPGQVQVRASACGICASDIYTFKHGVSGWHCPGHEGVGRVIKVGAGVGHLKEGDRVTGCCLGFTALANVWSNQVYKIPEDSTLADEHWIVEPVACVINGLDHCNLRAGDRVALVGCGFMGLMLMQGLGRSFADEIIAIDIDDHRLAMARQFGATRTYNSKDPSFKEAIEELKALRIDTVVDASGAQAGLDLSTEIVRSGGRLNLFGWNHGRPTFNGDRWHMEGITVINSAPNSALRDPWPAAIRLIHRGIIDLRPLVTDVVSLDEYPGLLARVLTRQNGYIKGVVRVG